MPTIMIKCPETGKPLKTGVETTKLIFEAHTYRGHAVSCPHCRKVHAWDKKKAYLQDTKVC